MSKNLVQFEFSQHNPTGHQLENLKRIQGFSGPAGLYELRQKRINKVFFCENDSILIPTNTSTHRVCKKSIEMLNVFINEWSCRLTVLPQRYKAVIKTLTSWALTLSVGVCDTAPQNEMCSSHSDSLSLMVTAFTSVYSARAYSPLEDRGENTQNRSTTPTARTGAIQKINCIQVQWGFLQLSSAARHLVSSERSLSVQGVVTVYPEQRKTEKLLLCLKALVLTSYFKSRPSKIIVQWWDPPDGASLQGCGHSESSVHAFRKDGRHQPILWTIGSLHSLLLTGEAEYTLHRTKDLTCDRDEES